MAQLKDLMVYGDAKFLANAMLDHDPTLNLEAATKHYVDQAVTGTITGSGTSGYLAKWNGSSSLTNGPQLGSDTTKFLNNAGGWTVPAGTTYSFSAPLSKNSSNAVSLSISTGLTVNNNALTIDSGWFEDELADAYSVGVGLSKSQTTFSLDTMFGAEFIAGTQTAATGSWTGVTKRTALYDGMQIAYWLPYAGSGNATLNLTLAGGGTTGAVNCYYNGTSRLTTHYGAGNLVHLTYRSNVNIGGTNYTGWWSNANYDSNDYDSLREYYAQPRVDANSDFDVYMYQLLLTTKSGTIVPYSNGHNAPTTYTKTMTTDSFDPFAPIYRWSVSWDRTEAKGAIIPAGYLYSASQLVDVRYYWNIVAGGTAGTTSLTANQPVYIKAKYTRTAHTAALVPNSSSSNYLERSSIVQTLPTSNPNSSLPATQTYIYIFLGYAYDSYRMVLYEQKPIYWWDPVSNIMGQFTDQPMTFGGSDGSSAGTPGLVPAPTANDAGKFLCGDGSWSTPANTTYSAGTGLTLSGTQFYVTSANVSTMMNLLSEGSSNATRNDYIIAQYAGGGTSTTTYHRRKLSNIFAALNSSDITTALGYTPYNSTNPNGYTSNTGTVTSVGFSAGTGISLSGNTTINTSGTVTITNSGVVGIKIGGNSATAQTGTVIFNAFSGTDGDSAGTIGLVPAPPATTAKQFLTNQGTWGVISASDIPTLGYLPLTGGTLTPPANSGSRAPLVVDCSAMTNTAWTEGIRIKPAANGWTSLMLCGTDNTATQNSSANSWSMHTYQGAFYLSRNGSTTANQQLTCASGLWTMKSDSTSTAAGTLTITSSAANANAHVLLDLLAPSLSAGSSGSYSTAWLRLGVALNTRNSGCLGFHYVGSGSTSNYLGIGLYAVDYVLNVVGTGRVGIKNTAPISELDVTGGISWSSKATSQYNATDDCVEFVFV